MKGVLLRAVLPVIVLCVVGCGPDRPAADASDDRDASPQVYAVNYPLAYFAERIAGDAVDVVFPAPADVDPATWSPPVDAVAAFQQADLVLLNGAGYAGWVQRVTLSQSRLVDTSAAFVDELIPVEDDVTHSHGPTGAHSHTGTAFTTWLNLELAIAQARAVADALVRLRPDDETGLRERQAALEADLVELDRDLLAVAARIGDRPLLFSHPVYQYLVQRYSLNGRAVHWEPDEPPSAEQWRELSSIVAVHKAGWMIWEGEPGAEAVARLRELGIESLVFRPCGNRAPMGDFLSVMRQNVQALEEAAP